MQNESVISAVHSCEVINAGKKVATQGYPLNGSNVLYAETYRKYKCNQVLSNFEKKVMYQTNSGDSVFRGPRAIRNHRKKLYEEKTAKDANGVSEVDREFKKEV